MSEPGKRAAAAGTPEGSRAEPAAAPVREVPEAAVARIALYLRVLTAHAQRGVHRISSEELALAAGVNSAKLRKDLSYLGSYGTRGVGYEVGVLIEQIEQRLGLDRRHSVAVVGVGNLGHALANYGGLLQAGFPVSALFDIDADLVGIPVGGLIVDHIDDIGLICRARGVTIGVIATPASAAQSVCSRLVAAGVRCILNFAPAVLQVPEDIEVRKVDLAAELQILSFHVSRGHTGTDDIELPGPSGVEYGEAAAERAPEPGRTDPATAQERKAQEQNATGGQQDGMVVSQ